MSSVFLRSLPKDKICDQGTAESIGYEESLTLLKTKLLFFTLSPFLFLFALCHLYARQQHFKLSKRKLQKQSKLWKQSILHNLFLENNLSCFVGTKSRLLLCRIHKAGPDGRGKGAFNMASSAKSCDSVNFSDHVVRCADTSPESLVNHWCLNALLLVPLEWNVSKIKSSIASLNLLQNATLNRFTPFR